MPPFGIPPYDTQTSLNLIRAWLGTRYSGEITRYAAFRNTAWSHIVACFKGQLLISNCYWGLNLQFRNPYTLEVGHKRAVNGGEQAEKEKLEIIPSHLDIIVRNKGQAVKRVDIFLEVRDCGITWQFDKPSIQTAYNEKDSLVEWCWGRLFWRLYICSASSK